MSAMYILDHVLRGARSPNEDPKSEPQNRNNGDREDEGVEEHSELQSPRPCDHFDLICGTSGGAVLAILLGCLRMTCMEAVRAYEMLGQTIYEEEEDQQVPVVSSDAAQERKKFVEVLEEMLAKVTGEADPLMSSMLKTGQGKMTCMASIERQSTFHILRLIIMPLCQKTFVTVSSAAVTLAGQVPHLIRNYATPRGQTQASPCGHEWTVKQTLLAATASAPAFAPMEIHIPPYAYYRYEDASQHGWANPAGIAWREAKALFGGRQPGAFVSVGIGLSALVSEVRERGAQSAETLVERLAKVAQDTEREHEGMVRSTEPL